MSKRRTRLDEWAASPSSPTQQQQQQRPPATNPYISAPYEPAPPRAAPQVTRSQSRRGFVPSSPPPVQDPHPYARSPYQPPTDEWEVVDNQDLSDYENNDDAGHLNDVNSGGGGGGGGGFMMRVSSSLANLTDAFGYMLTGGVSDGVEVSREEASGSGGFPFSPSSPLPPAAASRSNSNQKALVMKQRQQKYRTPTQRIQAQISRLNHRLEKYPLFSQLEEATGIPRLYLALGVVALAILVIIGGFGFKTLTALVGFSFPVYASFKTIEAPSAVALRHWLTYWVVFSIYCSFESVADHFLKFIPLFNLLKIVFLFWCFLPQYQGARLVYERLLLPMLTKLSVHIDEASQTVNKVVSFHTRQVVHKSRDLTKQLSSKLTTSSSKDS